MQTDNKTDKLHQPFTLCSALTNSTEMFQLFHLNFEINTATRCTRYPLHLTACLINNAHEYKTLHPF